MANNVIINKNEKGDYMKILILHLSDLHIKNKTYADDSVINPIVSSLAEMPSFDNVIIVFSGDIAFSGKKDEYTYAKYFMGKMIKRIKERYLDASQIIKTIIVPGNHDIDFKGESRARSEITKIRKNNNIHDLLIDDTNKMKNFFDFASANRSFTTSKLTEQIIVDFNDCKIQFNVINSAPCSILNDPNDDNDQSLHYLPQEELKKLEKRQDVTTCFTVMHHGLSWFDYNTEQSLKQKISLDSSILFVGHDHIQHSEYVNIDGSTDCLIVRGGTILPENQSEFNCILFDTEASRYVTYDCKSKDGHVYTVSKQQEIQLERSFIKNGFRIKRDYLLSLTSAGILGNSINEMMVFPSMIRFYDGVKEDKKIEKYDDFIKAIEDVRLCIIEGNSLSGKSQLLKYIFLHYFEKKIPLYIDADNLPKKNNIENIIKQAFFEQYSDQSSEYSRYQQLSTDEKVILVDNINRLKDAKSLIDKLKNKFSLVICTSTIASMVNPKDIVLMEVGRESEMCRLRIEDFYYEKRKELINKACNFLHPQLSETARNNKVKEINSFIEKQISIFNITPYFILNYCLNDAKRTHGDGNELNAFGEVFKANLVKSFEMNSDTRVDTAFFILGGIAYYIMTHKEYPLSLDRFNSLINDYNELYDNKVNSAIFLNNLIEAKILQFTSENEIKFCSLNILAYFAGKRISDVKNSEEGQEIIKDLIKNICFGINAEVLQFIIAFNNDLSLLNMLMNEIDTYFASLEEFSFDENNLPYLCTPISTLQLKAPDKIIKKEEVHRIEEKERQLTSKNIDVIDIFDYSDKDLEKFVNKQIRLHKLSILTASLYANFYHIIPADDKNKYVRAIYTQPNQIVYYLLQPFNKDFVLMIDEIFEEIHKDNDKITRENLAEIIVRISESIILNVFDFTARNCGTKETIESLVRYNTQNKNTNNEILLTMIYENMGNLMEFGKLAEKIDDETKYRIIKEMMQRIVHKHFVWNEVQLTGYGEHLADRYFGKNKKMMKLIRSKSIRQKK